MRRPYGFSLVEALITIFVVFLVFGVASGLLTEYSSLLNFSGAKESYFGAAQLAMKQMVDETRESVILESPSSGWSPNLTFQRIDPNYGLWLPGVALAQPFDPYNHTITTWTAQPAAQMIRVDYSVLGGKLLRSTVPLGGGTNTTSVVATAILGMQANRLASGGIQIQVSVEDNYKVVTPLTGLVLRPIP